jgi:hypothetical protein
MTLAKEKGRPGEGSPIPNVVLLARNEADSSDIARRLQTSRLASRCPVSAAMASILAPLVFGEVAS